MDGAVFAVCGSTGSSVRKDLRETPAVGGEDGTGRAAGAFGGAYEIYSESYETVP